MRLTALVKKWFKNSNVWFPVAPIATYDSPLALPCLTKGSSATVGTAMTLRRIMKTWRSCQTCSWILRWQKHAKATLRIHDGRWVDGPWQQRCKKSCGSCRLRGASTRTLGVQVDLQNTFKKGVPCSVDYIFQRNMWVPSHHCFCFHLLLAYCFSFHPIADDGSLGEEHLQGWCFWFLVVLGAFWSIPNQVSRSCLAQHIKISGQPSNDPEAHSVCCWSVR